MSTSYIVGPEGVAALKERFPEKFHSDMVKLLSYPEIDYSLDSHEYRIETLPVDEQVKKAKSIIIEFAKTDCPFIVVTGSPFILKGLDLYADLLEQSKDIEYIGADGQKTTVDKLFRPYANAFNKMTYGGHYLSDNPEDTEDKEME